MRAGWVAKSAAALALLLAGRTASAFAPSEFAHFADILPTGGDAVAQFHSVQVTLDTAAMIAAGSLRADGSDLAVAWDTSGAGTWIELDAHLRPAPNTTLAGSSATQVWFAVPDPAGWLNAQSAARYRVYYGRPAAAPADRRRDGKQVYRFFDDFSGSALDAATWYVHPAYAAAVHVSGGVLQQDGALSPGPVWQGAPIRMTTQTAAGVPTVSVSYLTPFAVECRFRSLNLADDVRPLSYLQHMSSPSQPNDHDEYTTFLKANGAQSIRYVRVKDGVGALMSANPTTIAAGVWYDLRAAVRLTNATPGSEQALHALSLDGVPMGDSAAAPRGGYEPSITTGVVGIETDPGAMGEYDWFLIRDAAAVEPVTEPEPWLGLMARELPGGTEISWTSPGIGSSFDLIRGTLSGVAASASWVGLGPVLCIADNTAALSMDASQLDASLPAAGEAYFYEVRVNGASGAAAGVGGYGVGTAGLRRVPSSGDCPP